MLTKSSSLVMVDPGRPGIPGQPARDFVMFAPPSLKGYMYNSKYAPSTVDQFAHGNWTMLVPAPKVVVDANTNPFDYKDYVSIADWNAYSMKVYGRSTSPSYDLNTWIVVTDQATGSILGWQRYTLTIGGIGLGGAVKTSDWYGPIANMVYITFPDVPSQPNGYPIPTTNAQKLRGYFDYNGTRWWLQYQIVGNSMVKLSGDYPVGGWHKNGVIACPAVAAVPSVPAVPPTYRVDLHPGWNTGANSIATHSENLKTIFTPSLTSVEAVGLYSAPDGFARDVVDYKTLDFAFLMYPSRYEIIERGVRVNRGGNGDSGSTVFEIHRVDGVVFYIVDGDVVYTSNMPSFGPLRVGTAIYSAPDGVL